MIQDEFTLYYENNGYNLLKQKRLTDNTSEDVKYVISSFDNLMPVLENNEQHFCYYTVQRTFRTKNNHIGLWGNDSFLLPFNIMLSSFAHGLRCEKQIITALEFLAKMIDLYKNDLYCVFSSGDQALVDNTIGKYLFSSNFICVPSNALKWSAPIGGQLVYGRYIKIYKRHYTGFALVMDCNIFPYLGEYITDITFPLFVHEAITKKLNTIYETELYCDVVKKAYEDVAVYDPLLFSGMFVSATIAISDGAIPDATAKGSPLRKIMRICYYSLDINKIDVISYLNLLERHFCKYIPGVVLEKKLVGNIWLKELERIKQQNKKANDLFKKKINVTNSDEDLVSLIKNMESTFGIDRRYSIRWLKDHGYNNEYVDRLLTLKHPTCAIPIDINKKNCEKKFLESLFLERI